jgi:hypothetical protein
VYAWCSHSESCSTLKSGPACLNGGCEQYRKQKCTHGIVYLHKYHPTATEFNSLVKNLTIKFNKMSNHRDKQPDDGEFHSQPVPKASSWILKKWRRPGKSVGEPSSSPQNPPEHPPENPPGNPPENPPENPQPRHKWIFPNEGSDNWSIDVVDFYINGDAQFCYSKFLDLNKLDRDFWGTLLGYQCNGRLWPMVNLLCFNTNYSIYNIICMILTNNFVIRHSM